MPFRRTLDDDVDLRSLEMRDAEPLFRLNDTHRESLRQWLPWLDGHLRVSDARDFIARALQQDSNNFGFWAGLWIGPMLSGVIGYHPINWHNRSTSLGYWLASEARGRGLMTRACQVMTDHAIAELGLNRVSIHVAPQNEKSRAIAHRLGFTYEGRLRQVEWLYDRYVDHLVYATLANEWRKTPTQECRLAPTNHHVGRESSALT